MIGVQRPAPRTGKVIRRQDRDLMAPPRQLRAPGLIGEEDRRMRIARRLQDDGDPAQAIRLHAPHGIANRIHRSSPSFAPREFS